MKKHTNRALRQFFALLLCTAMLLPILPAPISVQAATVASAVTDAQSVVDQVRGLYSGGTMSNALEMDCGNGLTGNGEKSYMTIVTGTTATHFSNYQAKLKATGYIVTCENTVASNSSKPNSFGSYTTADGSFKVYTYFLADYGETRIIVDTQSDTVEGYQYVPQTGVTVEPKLVLWGLSMASNGYNNGESRSRANIRNCGAIVIIRMPDNSLFINDGGDLEQWNDEACDEFLAFCRELTGTSEGEKMVINTWFLSHAHRDHYRGFYRFFNKYHEHFDLKNVMYTIDKERSGTNFDITGLLKLMRTNYPDVRYYKPHTGETVNIAGVEVDILYTLEDRFIPNSSKKLIIDTDNQGGTYRDGMYKTESTKTYDFNDTSTVVRVRFENGVSSILYGDLNKAATILTTIYPNSVLKTDIMMVPHHGFNELSALVTKADAKVYMYTQHKGGVYGPDDDVTTVDLYGTYSSSLRTKFLTMFPGMNVAKGKTANVDYQIFWGGSETVTIDINTLGNTANAYTSKAYYTSKPALNFEYTGWGITDLYSDNRDKLISVSDPVTEDPMNVTTTTMRFNPVSSGGLKDNGRYIIKHSSTNYVMSYDALAKTPGVANPAFSLSPTTENPVDSSRFDLYYENSKGIYLDHSNRALAMWILNQEGTSNDASLSTGPLGALFGGKAYGETWLNKGNASEFDSNGKQTAGRNGVYWHAIYGEDNNSTATQYRYLDPRYNNENWLTTSVPTGTDSKDPKKRYIIEDLGGGDFLIYWRSNSGETVCFLTCDIEGNWGIKKYTASTSDDYPAVPKKGSAELESLKLKLYQYKTFNDIKSVQFSGSKTFNVTVGTTLDQVNTFIQKNISLTDTTRHGLAIPCSGTTAQIGSYYLKYSKTFNSASASQYTVTVLFRNDDNTDTQITTLTVNVK